MDDRLGFTLLNRLLNGGDVWLAVAYLAGMFLAVLFRPEQIVNRGLFTFSYIVFAMYLLVPSLVEGLVLLTTLDRPGSSRADSTGMGVVVPMFQIFGRILFAISVVSALASFRVGRPRRDFAEGVVNIRD